MSTIVTTEKPDTCESKARNVFGLRSIAIAAALSGALLLGSGVFAAWTPTGVMTSGSYDSADLAVQLVDANGTTFSTGVSGLLPGDYMYRYADLTNSGTVAQTFTGSVTGTGILAGAVTVKVDSCSVSWASNGTCSGTTTAVKAETITSSPVSFSFSSMAVSAVKHIRFLFKLDANANQGTYQGQSVSEEIAISGSSTVSGGQDRSAG